MNKFIWEKQNALTSEFCRNVIYKFERDLRKIPGKTMGGVDETTKKSTDLTISYLNDWKEEDNIFCKNLSEILMEYRDYVSKNLKTLLQFNLVDTGYQIQRTIGGDGFYDWHHDFCLPEPFSTREITYIWYLNTIEGPGGETEFVDGTKIKPEEGKLIFFPATWTYVHRGIMPPKGTVKYIVTGWLHSNRMQ